MITATNDISFWLGVLMVIAFAVNIIVQLTKGFIKLPTKLWCILVSMAVVAGALLSGVSFGIVELRLGVIIISLFGSFAVAYVAMYGFDTLKDLWTRFQKGENINE